MNQTSQTLHQDIFLRSRPQTSDNDERRHPFGKYEILVYDEQGARFRVIMGSPAYEQDPARGPLWDLSLVSFKTSRPDIMQVHLPSYKAMVLEGQVRDQIIKSSDVILLVINDSHSWSFQPETLKNKVVFCWINRAGQEDRVLAWQQREKNRLVRNSQFQSNLYQWKEQCDPKLRVFRYYQPRFDPFRSPLEETNEKIAIMKELNPLTTFADIDLSPISRFGSFRGSAEEREMKMLKIKQELENIYQQVELKFGEPGGGNPTTDREREKEKAFEMLEKVSQPRSQPAPKEERKKKRRFSFSFNKDREIKREKRN